MKVIFLDIDGVLNRWPFYKERGKADCDERKLINHLDPRAIVRLNRIVAETGAVVVISATIRKIRSLEYIRKAFVDCGFTGEIVGATPTIHVSYARADEILAWMEGKQIENFVVLDDDSADLVKVKDRHIKTRMDHGLLDVHADIAIRMLKE